MPGFQKVGSKLNLTVFVWLLEGSGQVTGRDVLLRVFVRNLRQGLILRFGFVSGRPFSGWTFDRGFMCFKFVDGRPLNRLFCWSDSINIDLLDWGLYGFESFKSSLLNWALICKEFIIWVPLDWRLRCFDPLISGGSVVFISINQHRFISLMRCNSRPLYQWLRELALIYWLNFYIRSLREVVVLSRLERFLPWWHFSRPLNSYNLGFSTRHSLCKLASRLLYKLIVFISTLSKGNWQIMRLVFGHSILLGLV